MDEERNMSTKPAANHNKKKPFECDACNYATADKADIKKHFEAVHLKLKRYTCQLCGFNTYYEAALNNHILRHMGEKPFKCEQCPYTFTVKSALVRHRNHRHSELKQFSSGLCSFRAKTKDGLRRHEQTHFPEKLNPCLFECPLCSYKTKKKQVLEVHINAHAGINRFKCITCELCFGTPSSLSRHRCNQNSNVREFACALPDCDRKFKSNQCLRRHVRRVHNKEKNHQCSLCSSSFHLKSRLEEHVRRHTGEKLFKCELCSFDAYTKAGISNHFLLAHSPAPSSRCGPSSMSFKTEPDCLHSHEKTDLPERIKTTPCSKGCKIKNIIILKVIKKFKCQECELSFGTGPRLRSHMRHRHSDARPFPCPRPECERKFKSNEQLTRHIRGVHNKETNYQCTFCSSSFYYKQNFEEHVRRHTGEKPCKCELCDFRGHCPREIIRHVLHVHTPLQSFQCESCSKSFTSKMELKRHERVHDMSRKFPCKYCNYRGASVTGLKVHEGKFHKPEELTYYCRHCKSGYSEVDLKDHEKVCKAAPSSKDDSRRSVLTEEDCRPCSVVVTRLKLTI